MEKNSVSTPMKGIIICRVSTSQQSRKGTSLESQEIWAEHRATELNVEIVKAIRKDISGERFVKENFEFIVKLVEERGITHVFVYSFDRLSRSFSYGVMLVQSLWDRGVQIVTSTFTPNSDKLNDRLQVWFALLFAEMEHGGIHERTRRGMTTKLMSGIYPLHWIPFGYERIDLKISLKSGYKPVVRFIFETFIRVRCYNETTRHVNEKYGKKMDFVLKGRDIRRIVGDRMYLGYLRWGGSIFGEGDENKPRDELKAIDKETFEKAQVVAKQISARYSRCSGSPVKKLVEEYGAEPVVEVFNLRPPCPKCDSYDVQKNGEDGMVEGFPRLKYICKSCGHQFRSPVRKQIKRIEKLISFPCGKCGAQDQFVLEKDDSVIWKLRCSNCGHIVFLYEYCDLHTVVQFPRIKKSGSKKKMKYDEKQIQLQRWMQG